jgi:hypothetical protein
MVDRVIPKVPVRQWVLSFPIPLRSLFAVHPELLAPVLQIIHRVIATHLIKQVGIKRSAAATGAVTLIQRFGSAANLNIHLHGLVLDGVYHTGTEGCARIPPSACANGREAAGATGQDHHAYPATVDPRGASGRGGGHGCWRLTPNCGR